MERKINEQDKDWLKAGRDRLLEIIARYETQEAKPTLPMEMHTIRVGDIAFASNRFELYMDYVEATLKSLGELVE